jgi:hypothetical protein
MESTPHAVAKRRSVLTGSFVIHKRGISKMMYMIFFDFSKRGMRWSEEIVKDGTDGELEVVMRRAQPNDPRYMR